jgi:hypothetical protein
MVTGVSSSAGNAPVTRKECLVKKSRPLGDEPCVLGMQMARIFILMLPHHQVNNSLITLLHHSLRQSSGIHNELSIVPDPLHVFPI